MTPQQDRPPDSARSIASTPPLDHPDRPLWLAWLNRGTHLASAERAEAEGDHRNAESLRERAREHDLELRQRCRERRVFAHVGEGGIRFVPFDAPTPTTVIVRPRVRGAGRPRAARSRRTATSRDDGGDPPALARHALAEAQRILDGEARRLLAAQLAENVADLSRSAA